MLMKAVTVGGGGVQSSNEADTTQLLGSITAPNSSYTATEDSVMLGYLRTTATAGALYINDDINDKIAVVDTGNVNNAAVAYVGGATHGMFIPKGMKVTSSGNASYNTFAINIYKAKPL